MRHKLTDCILLVSIFASANGQINLGSFNLNRNPFGQWDLGFNQAANLFGFGGDRGFHLTGDQQGVGLKTNQGALVGGERVGVDSGFGVDKQNGLGLGSLLSFGNTPSNQPGGQLQSFIQNIGRFFQGLAPPPSGAPPPPRGSLGSVGVPIVKPAPNMPQQPDLPEEEVNVSGGSESESERETTFPTLLSTNSGESPTIEDRITKAPGRPSFAENIDAGFESTDAPVPKVRLQTKNPRRLPGLVDMADEH